MIKLIALRRIRKAAINSCVAGALVCITSSSIFILSCDQYKPRPYYTYYDDKSFPDSLERKENLCIISFSVDPILYTSSGEEFDIFPGFIPVATELYKNTDTMQDSLKNEVIHMTEIICHNFYKSFLSVFSERFNIVGNSNYKGVSFPIGDSLQIKKLLEANKAKYGIRIHNQFGAKWGHKNTAIDAYYFKVSTYIFDSEGKIAWKFCGKGSHILQLDFSLTGLLDGFAGKLSIETIVKGFKNFRTCYPRFLLRLIEYDAMGKEHGASITDYIQVKKTKILTVYNCNNEQALPNFRKTIYE